MYSLFEVTGIEIELMLVNRKTFQVAPVCDRLIEKISGKIQNEFSLGQVSVSNELANHVIEIKTQPPVVDIASSENDLQRVTETLLEAAARMDATLLGGGAHPLMNPANETVLWPHGQNEIYEDYDRIFGCTGHGWSNLQSVHINLPFANEKEFVLLHAAIRAVLPLTPGLAASTPFLERRRMQNLDERLIFYAQNQKKIPQISGQVIPEAISSYDEYDSAILQPMYTVVREQYNAPGLCEEWLNSRGAITRFDRNAIEIRVVDAQESISANVAIAAAIVRAVQAMTRLSARELNAMPHNKLLLQYTECIRSGSEASLGALKDFYSTICETKVENSREFWGHFLEQDNQLYSVYMSEGTLAERMLTIIANSVEEKKKVNGVIEKEQLVKLMQKMNLCLCENQILTF